MNIYQEKGRRKIESENSWGTKIRGWISKAFTVLVLLSIAKGFFGSNQAQGQEMWSRCDVDKIIITNVMYEWINYI